MDDGEETAKFTEMSVIAHVQLLHDLGFKLYEVVEEYWPYRDVGLSDVLVRWREHAEQV